MRSTQKKSSTPAPEGILQSHLSKLPQEVQAQVAKWRADSEQVERLRRLDASSYIQIIGTLGSAYMQEISDEMVTNNVEADQIKGSMLLSMRELTGFYQYLAE